MCGIVGFIGCKPAAPLLLEGLAKLEYRGYDSAGIALAGENGVVIHKAKGRLGVLREMIGDGAGLPETAGIGHTRWATHGKPSDENSHPHRSASGRFAVVHNGIIENYAALKKEMQEKGVVFLSETDTEVIAHLIEKAYAGDFLSAVRAAVARLEGSYALGVLCSEHPDELIAIRRSSPLVVGLAKEGTSSLPTCPPFFPYPPVLSACGRRNGGAAAGWGDGVRRGGPPCSKGGDAGHLGRLQRGKKGAIPIS